MTNQFRLSYPVFGKYRWIGVMFLFWTCIWATNLNAQGGCSSLTPTFINYEPCKFRVQIVNTSECTPFITVNLDPGVFDAWSVNSGAGWSAQLLAPNVIQLTHSQGFVPLGTSFPLIFSLAPGVVTEGNFTWEFICGIGESCTLFPGITLTSCPDPMDASIIGVKYRECGAAPYSNQTTIPNWTIQLFDLDGNLITEQATDAAGEYRFYDLPLGQYIVKEIAVQGWTPTVPQSGEYQVQLKASEQAVRNFGNCPGCSCDDIYMDVVQLPVSSDSCSYILNVSNNQHYCFNEINLKLAAGSFASLTPAPGWTATLVNPQHYKLTFPPNYIPAQSFQSTSFKVTGAAQHDITVSTFYNTGMGNVNCSRSFSYQCPPPVSPPPCCPLGSDFGAELVKNGDFSLGNQFFTNDYTYFSPGNATVIGGYSVLDYGQVYAANNQWACIDHTTYSTSGQMLIVDGYGGPNAWQQQVNVTAGTTYAFSAWVNNLVKPSKDYADPQMALFVDNLQVAGPLNLAENPDTWVRLCDTFTAQQTGLVTLYIRMLATSSIGNDVAIDDVSLRSCKKNPCIEDFETGGTGQWATANGSISVITDPITGSMVLKGSDNSGPSWMYNNSPDYNGDWTQKFNNCLCFDIRYDNGDPANPAAGVGALTIYQGTDPLNSTKRATFLVNTPIGNAWTRVCVPVGLSNGTSYPSNQYGQWTSTSLADFDMVMQGVSGIGIPLDFVGGPSPSEMVFVDDFCVEQCADTCYCGIWTDISYRPYQGAPNQTAECGDTLVAQCKGLTPWTMSGNFTCQGNNCPPTIPMTWMLLEPNGTLISGQMSGPAFNLSIPASDINAEGVYHLVLKGICGMDTCYCEFIIKVDCPCIEDFETSGTGQWAAINGAVSVITDPFTGSMVLKGSDSSGPSWMYNNSSDYNGDWTQRFNNCLCFDIRYDNGDPANPASGTSALTIYQGTDPLNSTKRATFVVNTPIGNTWTRICVPVGLSNGVSYPSNQYGQWTSTSLADFDMVMQGVSGIGIPLDFVGGPSPSEMIFVDNFCVEKCAESGCHCKTGDLTYSSAGANHIIPCQAGPNVPVFSCPTGPVTLSGDFGCVDANGNPCPTPPVTPINWILYGPGGIIHQGAITTGSPWSLPFTAADLQGAGFFTLYMTTLCTGQVDSCKCVATWFQECGPSCNCGNNPFDMSIHYGGAQNTPFKCGETVQVTPNSVVSINFQCQALPCNPAPTIDWKLTGPNGYLFSQNGVSATSFAIPQLQPTNFPYPGTYCLEMWGHCGLDTCPCKVYFCLPPDAPSVNDTAVCRTLTSAYIPLIGCPSVHCSIIQVDWYVKPGSVANFLPLPYQISPGPGCDPLLLLPYQYPNESSVQVYAVVHLGGDCCGAVLTTNIANIQLCHPISCSIQNPNNPFCQSGQPLPLTAQPGNANCNYTLEWYDETGGLVSTQATYTPPALSFPSGSSACYKDFVYTLKIKGVCGTSTCTTSIRVYNINADIGDLNINPAEPLPLCPGEDVILQYTDKCSGPPPKWTWYTSNDGVNFTPAPGAGMMNGIYYSNRLWQTTWFQVVAQNGVCPSKQETIKVDVKDPLMILNFTATPDACVEQSVNLSVAFKPSPNQGGGPAGCGYSIQWYKDGNLIHTSTSQTSPVSYTYTQPGAVAGIYYAVVTDDCCHQSVNTGAIIINPTCEPKIGGPCFICDQGPATLVGEMILPPQDPCPPNVVCSYQWYKQDINTGVWVPLAGQTGTTLTITMGGHYQWVTTCDYGYGPCVKSDFADVTQCRSTGNGCVKVETSEPGPDQNMNVELQPNPTSGDLDVVLHPAVLHKGRMSIVDMNGRELITALLPEGEQVHRVSLAKLPNGIYFVHIYEGKMPVWTGKVVRSE